MSKNSILDSFKFSPAALACIEETGADYQDDLTRLLRGDVTAESLLAHCLDGADSDRAQGWRDYVGALVAAAGAA